MQKTVTIDEKSLVKWQKVFHLTYSWQGRVPPVMAITLALGTLSEQIPLGYFLAKQKLSVKNIPPLNHELKLKGFITRKKQGKKVNYISCLVQVIYNNQIAIELSSTLIKINSNSTEIHGTVKPKQTEGIGATKYLKSNPAWRTFEPEQIDRFSQLSADPNPIHTGSEPIVQGMLILLALEDYLANKHLFLGEQEIQYLHPVRAKENIHLIEEKNRIFGLSSLKSSVTVPKIASVDSPVTALEGIRFKFKFKEA